MPVNVCAVAHFAERQAARRLRPLVDHAKEVERLFADKRNRVRIAREFGKFIDTLGPWDWFMSITFRTRRAESSRPVATTSRKGKFIRCEPDPRIGQWEPASRYSHRGDDRPSIDWALREVMDYLSNLEQAAGGTIRWVLGEDVGPASGLWHVHLYAAGVAHLSRYRWWQEAWYRFGRTTITAYDPKVEDGFYAAKYEAQQAGAIHFGGTLAPVGLSPNERSPCQAPVGRITVATSPERPPDF